MENINGHDYHAGPILSSTTPEPDDELYHWVAKCAKCQADLAEARRIEESAKAS